MKTTQLFIPDNILAGYNNRKDTYTGKLAYLIYKDTKGKLRKEKSWNSWIEKKLGSNEFVNEPIEGFVINKNIGGYKHDWFYRSEKVRVYDPRGFEIEITLDNLLYILEYTNSIKGKGLEGKLVYGWVGTDMFLIPCDSPQYKQIIEYNDLLRSDFKVNLKTIILGATYMTDKEETVVYLGRYNYYENKSMLKESADTAGKFNYYSIDKGKKYWFINSQGKIKTYGLNQIKALVNEVPDEKTSEYLEKLFALDEYKPFVTKDKHVIKNTDDLKSLLTKLSSFIDDSHRTSYSSYTATIYLLNESNEIHKEISLSKKIDNAYKVKSKNLYGYSYAKAINVVLEIKDVYVGYDTSKHYYSHRRTIYDKDSTNKKFDFYLDIKEKEINHSKLVKEFSEIIIDEKIIDKGINDFGTAIMNLLGTESFYELYGKKDEESYDRYLIDSNKFNYQLNKKHEVKK